MKAWTVFAQGKLPETPAIGDRACPAVLGQKLRVSQTAMVSRWIGGAGALPPRTSRASAAREAESKNWGEISTSASPRRRGPASSVKPGKDTGPAARDDIRGRATHGDHRFHEEALIEIIEWTDDSRDTLSWRFPPHEERNQERAQLIVRESQVAHSSTRPVGEASAGKAHVTTDNIRSAPIRAGNTPSKPDQGRRLQVVQSSRAQVGHGQPA